MAYVRGAKADGCPFCLPDPATDDRDRHILARGRRAYVCLNRFPYNNGHLLVVPYEHTGDIVDLAPDALAEMGELMRVSVVSLTRYAKPDGFNIGYNLGRAAGGGVTEHLHMHVIPRWAGDTSFQCLVSATRVIVQALEESYDELKPLVKEELARRGARPDAGAEGGPAP
jgi:ATP adenylyltransferase